MDKKIMDQVFVIIVTYNGEKWLQTCLNSVYNSSIFVKVVVIDNNSTDNTIAYIENNYPLVRIFKNNYNLGFGKANNIGIEYALNNHADFVYLLNQDAWIKSDTLEKLINIQKNNPEYGILSPMQINASNTKFDDYFATLCLGANKDNILFDLYNNEYKKNIYNVDFVMAAHWLISKECLMNTGGFSSVFYHYGEDNNFLHRAHFHGYKSGICPYINAIHDREFRKRKPHELFYLKYTSGFLVDLNNINNNLSKSISKSYFKLMLDEFKYVIKYKSIKPLVYIFKGLFVFRPSLSNREITKKNGPTFLNINNHV